MLLNVEYIRSLRVKNGLWGRELPVESGLFSRILNKQHGVGGRTLTGILKSFPICIGGEVIFLRQSSLNSSIEGASKTFLKTKSGITRGGCL